MLNIVLTGAGAVAVPGIPKYYLSDEDLVRLLRDGDLMSAFIHQYGAGVSIGRLGKLGLDGVYSENEKIEEVVSMTEDGDFGYYAKV